LSPNDGLTTTLTTTALDIEPAVDIP